MLGRRKGPIYVLGEDVSSHSLLSSFFSPLEGSHTFFGFLVIFSLSESSSISFTTSFAAMSLVLVNEVPGSAAVLPVIPPASPSAASVEEMAPEHDASPSQIPCVFGADDVSRLSSQYSIPVEFEIRIPGEADRANDPGPGQLCLYEESLKAGLRLPLHPFVVGVLRGFHLAPAQLAPNAWRCIFAMLVAAYEKGINLTPAMFFKMFKPAYF